MSRGSGVSRSDGQRVKTGAAGEPGEFLERTESMAALDRLLDDVRSRSEGRLVLVGGEAGVGKTTLLLRFCERHGTSARILWGGCQPLRTPRPLGPFLDVAEAIGGRLVGLVEGVARPYEVAAGLIRELGARGPTVLVLEDARRPVRRARRPRRLPARRGSSGATPDSELPGPWCYSAPARARPRSSPAAAATGPRPADAARCAPRKRPSRGRPFQSAGPRR
jgi:hypothetical protein